MILNLSLKLFLRLFLNAVHIKELVFMCGNFALWYVICFRKGDQWSPFLVHSIISVLFFVGAVPMMSIFLELFHMTALLLSFG